MPDEKPIESTPTDSPPANVETSPTAPSAESEILDSPDATTSSLDPKPIAEEVEIQPDLDAFEKLSGVKIEKSKDILPGEKKPEPFPKVEEPKKEEEEPKLEEEPVKLPEKKSLSTRDYTGLTPDEIVVAKNMSFQSFQKYKPLVLESRKLKEALKSKDEVIKSLQQGKEILPQNYYENPDAVIFSPSYRSAAKNTEIASLIVNHWETQLLKIKNGEEWTDLDNDPKTGELTLGQNRSATVQDEVRILSYLSGAQNQLNGFRTELKTIANNFKNENSKIISQIKETEKKFFPQYEGETPQVKEVGEAIKKLGVSESNPIFGLMKKSGALNIQLTELISSKDKEIWELKKKLGIKESIKRDSVRAGPSSSTLNSGGAVNGESSKVPDYTEFAKRLTP